jgi:hypothetical protein
MLTIIAAGICVPSAAVGHEATQHSATGLLGLPPEYVHVLLNPLPVYGLGLGVIILLAGLLMRSGQVQTVALALVVLTSLSAWPVFHYGQNAYRHVRHMSDEQGQDWLDEHMDRAEKVIYVFYATALLGIASLASSKKFPKASKAFALATLLVGIGAVGAGGWISRAGGQTRHPEFRESGAQPHQTEANHP